MRQARLGERLVLRRMRQARGAGALLSYSGGWERAPTLASGTASKAQFIVLNSEAPVELVPYVSLGIIAARKQTLVVERARELR